MSQKEATVSNYANMQKPNELEQEECLAGGEPPTSSPRFKDESPEMKYIIDIIDMFFRNKKTHEKQEWEQ